jgi:hypothetical protein
MAEGINYAKICFWVYIEYMYNCHESGELQRFDETTHYECIYKYMKIPKD